MTTLEKITPYLRAILEAETLEGAKREARLALRLIPETKGKN